VNGRRQNPRRRRLPALALAVTAALSLSALTTSPAGAAGRVAAVVERVTDGDTLTARVLSPGRGLQPTERVRLVGIDCPERGQAPWGARAARRLAELTLSRRVELEVAVQSRDRYGRLLAYVWAGGRLAQLVLVREGYCLTYTRPPNVEHAEALHEALQAARREGLGIHDPAHPLAERPADYRRRHRQ
jgi:micrococcal nuclease